MEILDLIKKRKTVRKYQDQPIPKRFLNKIVEAGRWGPSLVTFQPWLFIVITNKNVINGVYQIVLKKIKNMGVVGTTILNSTSKAILSAPVLIMIYNTGEFAEFASKFGKVHVRLAKIAEISAISATIQNMLLISENLDIGSCWHDTPLFCRNEINKFLNINKSYKLIAVLTFGYPAEKGKRSSRKPLSDLVKYIQ